MADIAHLGGLQPVEALDLDNYKDSQEPAPLPKKGRYTVQAPDSFPASAFGRTQAGAFSAQVDPKILGPTNEGYVIRFTKVSGKPFKRGGVTVSQVGDYLRACGYRVKISDEQQMADAIEQTANRTYEVDLEWRAYNKNTKFVLEGMDKFPSDGNGGHQPWVEDPVDKDPETGKPVKVRANLVVNRFIAASM